jgi:aminopeptidase N
MRSFLLMVVTLLAFGCKTQQGIPSDDTLVVTEIRNLDSIVITAPAIDRYEAEPEVIHALPEYRATPTHSTDILHTKLDLKFDWEKEQVIGKATLTLRPFFYASSEVVLDAKGFEFNSVRFATKKEQLKYTYDGNQIKIDLGRSITKEDEVVLFIDYIATPSASGGSSAITSDKGLYFINPRGEDPDKPQQIWTQGETESNSRWFPTVDKPNERCTQEMFLTVEDKYKTLSNGAFVSSKNNEDGTRTDYWKMDQTHAPYLFMVAVGEFAVVKDSWEGLPISYYVEPEYEKDAKAIYSNTPEMLSFFSEKLGVKYPWPKYDQIVVRDYVSGAMENTTAVIFGEFIQRHERELIDNNNELIIAHEMFHHWFGDYVTCESWSNLTMNEGFANYSEYLWLEHHEGLDAADHHMMDERFGYFNSAYREVHPLIHFGYDDKDDMFDAHSYNKGGAVLHMLRNYVGDEAFFASLNRYLNDNAYRPVEVHNLRLAFEAVTGQDLNWFFNQWYLEQGHPALNVTYGYDAQSQQASVTVEQTQDAESMPAIFKLPTFVDIYISPTSVVRERIVVDQREQTFTFDVPEKPQLITFDPDNALLATMEDNKTTANYIYQLHNSPRYSDRYQAVLALRTEDGEPAQMAVKSAMEDDYWHIRQLVVYELPSFDIEDKNVQDVLIDMAENDPHSSVRAAALDKLNAIGRDAEVIQVAKRIIDKEKAYPVIGGALELLSTKDKTTAAQYVKGLESEENWDIINAIANIYAESGDPTHLAFFESKLSQATGFEAISFFGTYIQLAEKAGLEYWSGSLDKLYAIATDMNQSVWGRVGAAAAINNARKSLGVSDAENILRLDTMLSEIKEKETNTQLKAIYDQQF